MAQPATITGTQLLIKIGDGASPEVFTHPCLINAERGIVFSSDANSEVVPDCDNPDDPGWKLVTKDGMQATITGAGKLDTASVATFDAWFRVDTTKTIRIQIGSDTPVGTWEGEFKLTEWSITGERGTRASANVTLVSDGEVGVFTPTP